MNPNIKNTRVEIPTNEAQEPKFRINRELALALGIPDEATTAEVRNSWKNAVRVLHPDKQANLSSAEHERAKLIKSLILDKYFQDPDYSVNSDDFESIINFLKQWSAAQANHLEAKTINKIFEPPQSNDNLDVATANRTPEEIEKDILIKQILRIKRVTEQDSVYNLTMVGLNIKSIPQLKDQLEKYAVITEIFELNKPNSESDFKHRLAMLNLYTLAMLKDKLNQLKNKKT